MMIPVMNRQSILLSHRNTHRCIESQLFDVVPASRESEYFPYPLYLNMGILYSSSIRLGRVHRPDIVVCEIAGGIEGFEMEGSGHGIGTWRN